MTKPSTVRTRVVEAYKAMPDAKLATIAEAAKVSYITAWRHLKAHLGVTLETHQVRAEVEAEQQAEAMLQPVVNTGQCSASHPPYPTDIPVNTGQCISKPSRLGSDTNTGG